MFRWEDSFSSQTMPTSARARIHLPWTFNMSNKTFGFTGMLEFKGNLWMDEMQLRPSEEIRVRSGKGVLEELPEQPDKFHPTSITPQVQSKEMIVHPKAKRTRLRTAQTVEMESKTFTLPEIYDPRESSTLDEYVASLAKDQLGPGSLSLFERLQGWKIETRARSNGKFDKFYHHEKSKKMFRSLMMVKMFIKNIESAPSGRRQKAETAKDDQGSLLCNCHDVSSRQPTLKRKRNAYSPRNASKEKKPKLAEDFQVKSTNHHHLNYLACAERRNDSCYFGILKEKLPLQLLR